LHGQHGIYLFNRDRLVDVLTKTDYRDFGKEIFPASIRAQHVQLHLFDGYWEDIGTIGAFYEANLALTGDNPPFDLALPEAPIYSRVRFLPPSRIDAASVRHSIVADGCRIAPGATIENSIIGVRCIIGKDVTVRNSVIMGADEYETNGEVYEKPLAGLPPVGIGEGSVIAGAIVDKNCRIGSGVHLEPAADQSDAEIVDQCMVRDGVPWSSRVRRSRMAGGSPPSRFSRRNWPGRSQLPTYLAYTAARLGNILRAIDDPRVRPEDRHDVSVHCQPQEEWV